MTSRAPTRSIPLLAFTALAPIASGVIDSGLLVPAGIVAAMFIAQRELHRPGNLSAMSVFFSGLAIDFFTGGPFGLWAAGFLAAFGLARGLGPAREKGLTWHAWIVVGSITAAVAGIVWIIGVSFVGRSIDWIPFAAGTVAALAIYPSMAAVLSVFSSIRRLPDAKEFR